MSCTAVNPGGPQMAACLLTLPDTAAGHGASEFREEFQMLSCSHHLNLTSTYHLDILTVNSHCQEKAFMN